MIARLYWHLDPPSSHYLKNNLKNQNLVGPPLTKLSGSVHGYPYPATIFDMRM